MCNQRLFFLIAFLTVIFIGCTPDMTKARVEGGLVEGYTDNEVTIFKAVPFAAPPVGELRWKAPQPVVPWSGILHCTANPPSAVQAKSKPFYCWSAEFLIPEEPISEDCLYLNIWTAAAKKGEKRPVIVWIHGGALTGGSGTVPLYDGTEMAKKGVVFVTINYRLGVLGFFAHPGLSAESPDGVSGNYGILDQIAALKWVRNNIAAFGGDPGKVTIAGQSAGSFSVNVLMTTPLAKGLFQRAIGQSGAMFGKRGVFMQDLKNAEAAGLEYGKKLGASSIADLRAKTSEELLATPIRTSLIRDSVVVMPASAVFESGTQNDVPLLTGWNADDGISFGPPVSAETFISDAKNRYGDLAGKFLAAFPAGNEEEAKTSQKSISQMFFGWQNYTWTTMQSKTGKNKAYLYYFSHVPPGEPNYGAFHSAELGYTLKTLKHWNRPFTDYDYKLSEIMSSYWINFAKTGDPNCEDLPIWPSFNPSSQLRMIFGDEIGAAPLSSREQFVFFDLINN